MRHPSRLHGRALRVAGLALGLFAAALPAAALEVPLTPSFAYQDLNGATQTLSQVQTEGMPIEEITALRRQLAAAAGADNNYARAAGILLEEERGYSGLEYAIGSDFEGAPESLRSPDRSVNLSDLSICASPEPRGARRTRSSSPLTPTYFARLDALAAEEEALLAAFPEVGQALQALREEGCPVIDLDELSFE